MCVNEHFISRVFQDMLSGVSFITILGHVSVKMAISKNILEKGCPGVLFLDGADGGYWVNIFACRRVFSTILGRRVSPKPSLAGLPSVFN